MGASATLLSASIISVMVGRSSLAPFRTITVPTATAAVDGYIGAPCTLEVRTGGIATTRALAGNWTAPP